MMRKLYYMGLEPYNARYTLQLTEWNRRVFEKRGTAVVYVPGETLDSTKNISVGQVLDAHGRSYFAMSQMMNLVKMMREGEITSEDVIYLEDMFQPGFESLGYIINQVDEKYRPKIFVRCLAQSIDPDDFVHVWGLEKWMYSYERMANEIVKVSKGAVLATNEEMVAHMRIAGWDVPIYNISGLAFGKQEVLERVNNVIVPFDDRPMRVGFAARWDQEKQPNFYMDLIEEYHSIHSGAKHQVEFCVFSGGDLRSNDPASLIRARELEQRGLLKIYENLDKNEYYNMLNHSRVLFNCALQDWVSNTVSEADTLGCNVLYPAYRSFPETFANDADRLYVPWSMDDALNKLDNLLQKPHYNMGKISDYNDGTIDRICDILAGNGHSYLREATDYRKHTTEAKFK